MELPPTFTPLPVELQVRLDSLVQRMPAFWERQPHRHYTLQGERHSLRVQRIALSIANELEDANKLSPVETFILCSAAWLYEIGFQARCPIPGLGLDWSYQKPLNRFGLGELRSKKHLFTEQMILESLSLGGEPLVTGLALPADDVTRSVVEVCRGCSNENITNIQEILPALGNEVRVRLLTAILRLADRLYMDKERVNVQTLMNFNLPPDIFAIWAVFPFVQSLPLQNQKMRFFYLLPSWLQDYFANIRGVLERQFDPSNDPTLLYLWSCGLYLSLHDTPLWQTDRVARPWTTEFVDALVGALQRVDPIQVTSVEVIPATISGTNALDLTPTAAEVAIGIDMQVILLSRTLPTSYYRHLDAVNFPFVSIHIHHKKNFSRSRLLRISTYIEDISDHAVTTIVSRAGDTIQAALLPVLKPSKVAELHNPRRATLHIMIEDIQQRAICLYEHSEIITLLSKTTALLATLQPDGEVIELFDYLAAWVTPYARGFDNLLRLAANYLPHQKYFVGYQGAKSEHEKRMIVREQVQAIFQILHEHVELIYINSVLSMGEDVNHVAQHVRLPSESIHAGGAANCIDGTVLFASLLEAASIFPLLVIIRGHAFVGWRIWDDSEQCEFLETTMIHTGDFNAALDVGQELFNQAVLKDDFNHLISDPIGFARLVDVRSCRRKNIFPIE